MSKTFVICFWFSWKSRDETSILADTRHDGDAQIQILFQACWSWRYFLPILPQWGRKCLHLDTILKPSFPGLWVWAHLFVFSKLNFWLLHRSEWQQWEWCVSSVWMRCKSTESSVWSLRHYAHVIGFPEGKKPWANVGTLQTSSAIAPPTGALFFMKSPTLSPVPGTLQLCKQHANEYD